MVGYAGGLVDRYFNGLLVLQHAGDGVDFLDPRHGTDHCMLAIAANALNAGYVVAGHTKYAQPYVEVGHGWCMATLT